MKLIKTIIAGVVLAAAVMPSSVGATGSSDLRLEVLPLECQFEIINDGNNTIHYITPEECGQNPTPFFDPPPSSNSSTAAQPSAQSSGLTVSNLSSTGLIPSEPGSGTITPTGVCGARTTNYYLNAARPLYSMQLPLGRTMCFELQAGDSVEGHTITVKEVGSNYVIVTVASHPTDVHLYVGQTKQHDAVHDGQADIELTLNDIVGGVADLTFKNLLAAEAGSTSEAEPKGNGYSSMWQYLVLAAIVIATVALGWLVRHKRKTSF